MTVSRRDQEGAINDLVSSIIRHIFKDGVLNVQNCVAISNQLRQWAKIPSEPEVASNLNAVFTIPTAYELRSRLGLAERGAASVLHHLMNNTDRLYSTKDLGDDLRLSSSSVRVFVSTLRKSLRKIGLDDVVETQYGVGYILPLRSAYKVVKHMYAEDEAGTYAAEELAETSNEEYLEDDEVLHSESV
jgi:DNA-binding winged helix-turn-helix (wHTH) protein